MENTTEQKADFLGPDEVAAWFGVARKTVLCAAAAGTIPHQRLGRRLLFNRQAITSWLESTGGVRRGRIVSRNKVPTVRQFSRVFIETSRLRNKASTIDAKNAVLNCHILPLIGR